jgi:sialidase-1
MPRALCCPLAIAAVLFLTLGSDATAAQPLLTKTDLFTADVGGYASYRIPCLTVTPQGTLLAFCEARKTRGDWAAIDILLRRSTDGGQTWSPPQTVSQLTGPYVRNPVAPKRKDGQPDEPTFNNPLAIVDAQGVVHFLYCLDYMRAFYARSDDDGASFRPPREITSAFDAFRPEYDWKVLAVGPGHGIALREGRLLATAWLSTAKGSNAHHPSVIATVFSNDSGQSWQRGEIVTGERDPLVDPSEHQAVQLADGRVLLNIRSDGPAHRRAVAISSDGATQWSRPKFDDMLVEPICMASICRLSLANGGGKNRLLFSNPANLERADGKAVAGKSRDRRNLTIRLSYDEADTWPEGKTLEAGPSAYSDLAVGPDHTIYCLYERGGRDPRDPKKVTPTTLTLARFNIEWLTDGRDTIERRP